MLHATHSGRPVLLCMSPAPNPGGWIDAESLARSFNLLRAGEAKTATTLLRSCRPDLLLINASEFGPDAVASVVEEASRLFSARWPIVRLAREDVLGDSSPVLNVLEGRIEATIAADVEEAKAAILLRAVLRRTRPTALTDRLTWDELALDQLERRATWSGRTLPLSFLEFNLLGLLLDSGGIVWSRSDLARLIWGPRHASDVPSLYRTVQLLRQTLRDAGGHDPVETLRGAGYRLAEPRS